MTSQQKFQHLMERLRTETLAAVDHDRVEALANKLNQLSLGVPVVDIMAAYAAVITSMVRHYGDDGAAEMIPVTILSLVNEMLSPHGRVSVDIVEGSDLAVRSH